MGGQGAFGGQNFQLDCFLVELEEINQDSDRKEKQIRELWSKDDFIIRCEW